jgi:hypothetical protein
MDDLPPPPPALPPRVPPVEPELLGSAIFLFREYLEEIAAEAPPPDEEEDEAPPIDTRAVLDLFAEELGTGVQATLTLYLRVTALYRLLAQSPSLAALAIDAEEPGGGFTEDALLAAARLDLNVTRRGADGAADFDPRQFRAALERA